MFSYLNNGRGKKKGACYFQKGKNSLLSFLYIHIQVNPTNTLESVIFSLKCYVVSDPSSLFPAFNFFFLAFFRLIYRYMYLYKFSFQFSSYIDELYVLRITKMKIKTGTLCTRIFGPINQECFKSKKYAPTPSY